MTNEILLPPQNTTKWEAAVAQAIDLSDDLQSAITSMRGVKYRTPNVTMLPFLVYEYGLGELTPYLPNLYNLIEQGVRWQRLRGTVSAVAIGLAWIGYTATIEEAWTGRNWWNSFQLRFPSLPLNDAPDLERIEGITRLSVAIRSDLRRGVYGYDVQALEAEYGRLDESMLDFESGTTVTQAGTIWSFGRQSIEEYQPSEEEGRRIGYWAEVDWLNPGSASPRWATMTDVLWADANFLWASDQQTIRLQVMAGFFSGMQLYVRFADAAGEVIGYRRVRANHVVSVDFDGVYKVGDLKYSPRITGTQLYVEAMTQFDDVFDRTCTEVSIVIGGTRAPGVKPGKQWLLPGQLTEGQIFARRAVNMPMRKTVREQVAWLIKFDVETFPPGALVMGGNELNVLAIDFTDDSAFSRSTSNAERQLEGMPGVAIDFTDNSFAKGV